MRTIAIIVLLILSALPAHAHVFKHFETLSVLLHMEPGDDPIAGEPGQLFFYFSDKADRFRVSECDCRVRILENGDVLYDEPLTAEAKGYGEQVRLVNFTFPHKGLYSVELEAKEGHYGPFTLQYDVRIERVTERPAKEVAPDAWEWGGIAIAIFLGALLGYGLFRWKHRRSL